LFKLSKKGVKFIWDKEQDDSYNELKIKLASAPILTMPNFDKQFIIRTDASYDGIGGVFLQKDENNIEKPTHFVSRSLKPAEKNYAITDLEGKLRLTVLQNSSLILLEISMKHFFTQTTNHL